ncbi:hypothetical protein BKA56DRAFT_624397 [Ilyonectria sp. MPI-CAGE-AT-0026]|nr:hypothetical protein BKA56DRAFT_624397 [Ilyonectria sp. MPI-CAGE-AT-0026]
MSSDAIICKIAKLETTPTQRRWDCGKSGWTVANDGSRCSRCKACQSASLRGIRIGIPRQSFLSVEPDESKAFEKVISELQKAGAELVDNVEILTAKDWESYSSTDRMTLAIADLADSLADYFKTLKTNPKNLHSLEDVVEYIKRAPAEDYPRYNQYKSEKFNKLEKLRAYIASEGGIDGLLDRAKLDVLVTPTAASTPVKFPSLGDSPLIEVPLGFYGPDTPIAKGKKADAIALAPGIP